MMDALQHVNLNLAIETVVVMDGISLSLMEYARLYVVMDIKGTSNNVTMEIFLIMMVAINIAWLNLFSYQNKILVGLV